MKKDEKGKKKRRDPREEYKIVDTYNTETDITADDILTSREFVDYIYQLVIKYS